MHISFTQDSQPGVDGKFRRNGNRAKKKVYKASFEEFGESKAAARELSISFLADLEMKIKVELGRTVKTAREVLTLEVGSIIELDRAAGENVDIFLNEEFFAKGEVVVLDETYGVRITSVPKE